MVCPECKCKVRDGETLCEVCGTDLTEKKPLPDDLRTVKAKPADGGYDSENDDGEKKLERREVRVNAGIYKLICIAMGLCLVAGSVVWATIMLRDRIDSPVKNAPSAEESISSEQGAASSGKDASSAAETTTVTTADPYKQAVAPQFEDDYGTMYVSSDSLVMRIGPGYDYEKTEGGESLSMGTALSILAEQEDAKSGETWCFTEYGGAEGWICKTYLSATNPTVAVVKPDEYYSDETEISVTRYGGLILYSGPDESYDVIAEIPQGESITRVGYNYMSVKWKYIKYGDQYGWIISYDGDWFNPTVE